MDNTQDWDTMYRFGSIHEDKVFKLIKQINPNAKKINNSKGDIYLPDFGYIEVKAENLSAVSKRIWLEVSKTKFINGIRNAEKSGLLISESKLWIQTDSGNTTHIILTKDLKEFLIKNHKKLQFLKDIKTNQGDYYTFNSCYVIYYKDLVKLSLWSGDMNELSVEKLKEIINKL